MKVTRDVVTDLWPVYQAGEASADTRELVEAFLREDPEFARLIREAPGAALLEPIPAALEPDHEMKSFLKTRRAIYGKDWSLFLAMLFSSLAFGRIVSDTSWDVSPRHFIVVASIAAAFWIAFLVRHVRKLTSLR